MSPWLWMLVGAALSGAVTWYLLRRMESRQNRQHDAICHWLSNLDVGQDAIAGALNAYQQTLEREAAPHPLTGTAFLPTDADSAAMEKLILASEDRAIRAGGGQPSARRARTSGERLRPASLTRQGRSSGGAS